MAPPKSRKRLRTTAEIHSHLWKALGLSTKEPLINKNEFSPSTSKRPRVTNSLTSRPNTPEEQVGEGSRAQTPEISEDQDADIQDNNSNEEENENHAVPHPIYSRGKAVYEDHFCKVFVKAVQHNRRTQYSLSDHLFNVWIEPKGSNPYIVDLEGALEKALIQILDSLKAVYNATQNQNQIYITIIEKNILHGLNSGNYSLQTPSQKIVRWVLSMLYNYLKSDQTLKLNDTFKIQIKVLSLRHVQDLEKFRRKFKRHIYH